MDSQPVRGEAGRRRAEGQFKSKKKADVQTPRADAHFGWQRKRPTGIPQVATRRQRWPAKRKRAGAFQDLRSRMLPNPRKGLDASS